MKKTTYILLGLVSLIFIIELAVGIYLYANRLSEEECRAIHPEWFSGYSGAVLDDSYVEDADTEADIDVIEEIDTVQHATTVIDAANGAYNVLITVDNVHKGHTEVFYTDTLIITSPSKNIRVVR